MTRKLILTGIFALLSTLALAQEGPLNPAPPNGISVDQIIQQFASKEKDFKQARDNYTYTQDVTVRTPEDGGTYHEVFDVTFDDRGRRIENVKYAPQSSLQRIQITREDLDDIRNRLPFVLTSDELPEYNIQYVGQQQEDELRTYVFDIHPRAILGNKRFFDGRIWVDDKDFQIVKTYGKTVPDRIKTKQGENLFPRFTTYREQIDGRYWFPTYTRADDTLNFSTGSVRIIEIVKYSNYKRFGSKTKITYEGQELPGTQQQQKQPPPK
jgi:outer membrane lipoprotein-sorting protein